MGIRFAIGAISILVASTACGGAAPSTGSTSPTATEAPTAVTASPGPTPTPTLIPTAGATATLAPTPTPALCTTANSSTGKEAISQKVMLVVYDPILKDRGGQRLHAAYGWEDPKTLTAGVVKDLETASHGIVTFDIVETRVLDAFPRHVDGFVYTVSTWERDETNWQPHKSQFDWQDFLDTNGIVAKIDSCAIDEVWIYQDPVDQDSANESTMAGDGAYWVNGGPIGGDNGPRAFVIMSWNYQRGVAEALHSYGHRTENAMCHVYGIPAGDTCVDPSQGTNWSKFVATDLKAPGQGGLGDVHHPVNAQDSPDHGGGDYDYYDMAKVMSNADAWLTYPVLPDTRRLINATEWSPQGSDPQREYLDWWYAHMPRVSGRNADGLLNDWWRYIVEIDRYKNGDRGA